jgi:anti-sigma regulatory factor (Ser/Thr protein kinase)
LAVWELVLATSELSTNAARAARAGYRVRAWMETGAVVLEVVDDGSGFDGQLPNPDDTVPLDAERGRGLSLVRSLTDECTVRSTTAGTVVRVKKLV